MLQAAIEILLVIFGIKVAKRLPGSIGELAQAADRIVDSTAGIAKGGANQLADIFDDFEKSFGNTAPKSKK